MSWIRFTEKTTPALSDSMPGKARVASSNSRARDDGLRTSRISQNHRWAGRALAVAFLSILLTCANAEVDPGFAALQKTQPKMEELIRQTPPLIHHYEGVTETD